MRRLLCLSAVGASLAGVLAMSSLSAHAQTTASAAQSPPTTVTVTFELTINGTPALGDSFAVQWGDTGLQVCTAPCSGRGHTYVRTTTFPTGVTETFVFVRAFRPVTPGNPGQDFVRRTLTVDSDRTLSAVFTYGAASVPTPTAGASVPFLYGAAVAGCGVALLLLLPWVRRRSFRLG